MYSPIFRALKNLSPSAQVDVVFSDFGAELYSQDANIDKIFLFNRKQDSLKKQFRLVREFRKAHYDFSLHLRSGVRNEMLACFGGAKKRLGRNLKGSCQFLTSYVSKIANQHAKDEYKEFLKAIFGQEKGFLPYLPANVEESENVERFLLSQNVEKGFVVVHPFGDTISPDCWRSDIFGKIISRLQLPVFVLGRQKEVENFPFFAESKAKFLTDKNLGFVSELLRRATFFVGNDSGIFHIAECHKVKSFVFFQNDKANFLKWSPIEKSSKSFFAKDFSDEKLGEIVGEINEKA